MARLPVKALGKLVAFGAVVLLVYAFTFYWIEHRRVAKGPWIVDFGYEGFAARLTVNQHSSGITNVQIVLRAIRPLTNAPAQVHFVTARNPPFAVPFGECVFQDLLFLPGTIVLRIGGHELQFLPRCLTIDRTEHPWRNGEIIHLD